MVMLRLMAKPVYSIQMIVVKEVIRVTSDLDGVLDTMTSQVPSLRIYIWSKVHVAFEPGKRQ